MQPQIRYCTTADGLSIAYFTLGAGRPLIGTSPSLSMTIADEFEVESLRRIAELTARAFTYIRFDPHGCGLSDRDAGDLSVEAFVRDIVAVADAAAKEPLVLFANGGMTAPAIAYAAQHPERLTHLVLWVPSAFPGDSSWPNQEELWAIAQRDWRTATEMAIRSVDSWEHDEHASRMAALLRESVRPDVWVRFQQAQRAWDVSAFLPQIRTPTLVMYPRNHPYFPASRAQRIAAAIPGASLRLLDTRTVLFPDPSISFAAADFLRDNEPRLPSRAAPSSTGTAIILFADIADSTEMTERMGDAAFREKARALDVGLRRCVREHRGAVIDAKTLGDGILATFASASQGIAAAIACGAAGEAQGLPLHLGLHAGDVIRESDNVFGGAVNIAARISALSAPGEVLVSDVVRALARTSAGVTFEDRGEHALKGVAEAQRVFAVRGADTS